MGRGRPSKITDTRLLIELLLYPDRGVFTSEIAKSVDVSPQTVRERMRSLEDDGLVDIQDLDAGSLYRLTDDGVEHISTVLRDEFS